MTQADTGRRSRFRPARAHLWQTARLLLACALAELAGVTLGLGETYWTLITTIVVTRPAQADARGKGRDRTLGSIIGALAGFAVLTLETAGLPRMPLFLIAFVLLAFLMSVWPNLRMAAITLVVVVLIPSSNDPLVRPFDRVIEILVGSLAGWLVSVALDSDRLRRSVPERWAPEAEG